MCSAVTATVESFGTAFRMIFDPLRKPQAKAIIVMKSWMGLQEEKQVNNRAIEGGELIYGTGQAKSGGIEVGMNWFGAFTSTLRSSDHGEGLHDKSLMQLSMG
jgi:hypothetical protein